MKKSELKRIIQEELKGYSKYAPGGETKGGTTDDFRNILTTIAKSVPKEDSEEETVSEEATDVKNVEISYVYPGGRFYGVRADGVKLPGFDAAKEFIKNHTGLELPTRAYFDDKEILDIVDALKAKGIQATSSEMDVS